MTEENRYGKKRVIKQKEIVYEFPLREGVDFRFSIVEEDGVQRGDMRYFQKGRREEVMLPTKRGIPYPEKPQEFLKGFKKLGEKLTA